MNIVDDEIENNEEIQLMKEEVQNPRNIECSVLRIHPIKIHKNNGLYSPKNPYNLSIKRKKHHNQSRYTL